MAYLVSQLRKSTEYQYMKKLNIVETYHFSKDPFGQDRYFKDYAISLARKDSDPLDNIPLFESGATYYIRFKVARIPQYYYSSNTASGKHNTNYYQADTLNLTLFLCKKNEDGKGKEDDESKDTYQTIGTCSIPMTTSDSDASYSVFSFVFTPVDNFRYLVFKIQRNTYDAIENSVLESGETEGLGGRTWLIDTDSSAQMESYEQVERDRSTANNAEDITTLKIPNKRIFVDYNDTDNLDTVLAKGQVCELNNLLNYSNSSNWLKLGYQSRPGNLIVINKQPIRVGRSGIFEINNGMVIDSFMIAAPGGAYPGAANIDAFLLDYAYQS